MRTDRDLTAPQPPTWRELRTIVEGAGLLDSQPRYYAWKIASTLAMIAGVLTLVVLLGESWWQLGAAALLAVVATQTALLAHDAGHRQIFRAPSTNDLLALLITSPFVGFSFSWWMNQHNQHHGAPNHEERDPNINVRFWAFTEAQRRARTGLNGWLVRYQAVLLIPLNLLGAFYKVIESANFLRQARLRHPSWERAMFLAHLAWFAPLPFIVLSVPQAIAFIAVYYAAFGLYLGAIISPNHKGMRMVSEDDDLDFLHWQVLTARNVRGGRLTDFLYGGLNYQIEHHLFPNMPRNRLREATIIVSAYCRDHGIPYHEASFIGSFREILASMHASGAATRDLPVPTTG